MKIYTKTGDDGTTSLFGGKRVQKFDERVDTYGEIDELNSVIGIALAFISSNEVENDLLYVQSKLFEIGALIATPDDDRSKLKGINDIQEDDVALIEKRIDYYEKLLPKLKSFILPGGTKSSSFLHFARTVCRRCERKIVKFAFEKGKYQNLIKYFNRLSDFLFVLARYENYFSGKKEIEWKI